jgi:hypothetical protein
MHTIFSNIFYEFFIMVLNQSQFLISCLLLGQKFYNDNSSIKVYTHGYQNTSAAIFKTWDSSFYSRKAGGTKTYKFFNGSGAIAEKGLDGTDHAPGGNRQVCLFRLNILMRFHHFLIKLSYTKCAPGIF